MQRLKEEDLPGGMFAANVMDQSVRMMSTAEDVGGKSNGKRQGTTYPKNRGSDCSGR